MHACLCCKHFALAQNPISMTTGRHLHMAFACLNPCLPDAYGQQSVEGSMIYDLCTDTAWVDGSVSVPAGGCANFELAPAVNREVLA